jgi:hypothetical protein
MRRSKAVSSQPPRPAAAPARALGCPAPYLARACRPAVRVPPSLPPPPSRSRSLRGAPRPSAPARLPPPPANKPIFQIEYTLTDYTRACKCQGYYGMVTNQKVRLHLGGPAAATPAFLPRCPCFLHPAEGGARLPSCLARSIEPLAP